MPSNIKVISPYISQNGGDSVLTSIELSSQNSIKEISIALTAGATGTELYTFSLTGATGGISLGPTGLTSANLLQASQRATTFIRSSSDAFSGYLSLTSSYGTVSTSSGVEISAINVQKNSFTEKTKRDLSHLYNVNAQGNYIVQSNSSPLQEVKTSFSLLRTNPKLTGNVKLTVDSAQQIWLNSIEANRDLADSRFKKVPVSYNSNYAIDVRNFFDAGKTPPEIVYSLYQETTSYFSTQREYAKQYDRFYTYGAYQLNEKSYDEDFAFFAPLRIDDKLPDYFVIFRTDGPFNPFTYENPTANWKNFINDEIIKKSSVVKTFDLSQKSSVGKYLRNLINHPARKESEMSVSFQRDGYTTFNGIEYTKGSFAQKGELLSDFYNTPNTVIGLEEFLSLGFERNRLISPSIINMEFLFDDPDAEDYTINRYFGLYLSANQIADFFLSDKALSQFSSAVGQTPIPRPGVQGNKFTVKPFVQTNANGIKIFVDSQTISRTNYQENVFDTIVSGVTGSSGVYFSGQWEENPYLSVGDSISFTGMGFTSTVSAISQDTENPNRALITLATGYTGSGSLLGSVANFYTVEKEENRKLEAFDNDQIANFSRIFYLQDKNGDFYNVSGSSHVETKINSFDYQTDIQLSLVDRKIDISNFSGTNEMLTQAEATVYTDKGKASLEIEISQAFQQGDSVEIRWETANSTEPTRWVLQASSTSLMPGEVWPDYLILTDIDNTKYYYTTFHPGVNTDLSQVAQTLKKGFDVFPFRLFETVVEENKIYFKSKVEGEASNNLLLKLDQNTSSVKAYGFNSPSGQSSLNFFGGTETPKKRARIPKSVAIGILESEYFKTIGSFSLLKKFDVWGNSILYATSAEEEVYVDDVLTDFSDKNDYAIIELAEDAKFDKTFDNKVTSYNLYRGKFGVFTIFPVRDFDTDYFNSDYAKNYDPELIQYFYNSGKYGISSVNPISGEVVLDRAYTPTGITGSFEVPFIGVYDSGKSPKDYNGLVKLHFTNPGYTATAVYYLGPSGTWNLFSTPEIVLGTIDAPESIVPLPEDKILYFEEDDLSKFKGFFSLSSVVSQEDMAEFSYLESQWEFSRFLKNKINTEYLRSYENFTTDYALTSKVVPYICKWVSHDGKDVRDNPYRFNYNRAFGTMNFTPSAEYTVPDTRFHTHEWPYLANVPYYLNPQQYKTLLFSYFFEKPLEYDFESVTRDWFSEYFTVGYPTELYYEDGNYNRVPLETTERYSVFKFDPLSEKTYTMFRGVRLEIGELIQGSVVIGSKKYVDYKFSSVIVPIQEDDSSYHDPLDFEIIVNEKFKFILNIIKIRAASYKNPEGNISYIDLYTFQNKRDRGTYTFDYTKVFSTTPIGVLPTVSYNKGVPSDVMLQGPVNLVNGKPINPLLIDTSTINPLIGSGVYSFLFGYKQVTSLNAEYTSLSQDIKQVEENKITFASGNTFIFNPILKFSSNASALGNSEWIQYNTYYASGGDNYYTRLRNLLSFYEISRALSGVSDKITPIKKTVAKDGTVTTDIAISFAIVSPEQVLQSTDIIPVPDDNKPPQLYSYDVIGMELTTYTDPQFLYRYQGDFVPKFRDVFFFASREEKYFSLLFNNDFRLANTLFVDSIEEAYELTNQYYSKVADEEILMIPPGSGYQSLYPAVDEISIDKRNLFVWNSSWDKNYYRKYSTVSAWTDEKGSSEMKEIRSFLGSKMMKLPKSYSLYQYLESEYTFNESVKVNTLIASASATSQTFYTVEIDVYEKLLRELKGTSVEEKARKEFIAISQTYPDVISPAEIDDKVDEYLRDNIMSLFEIDRVNFYLLETGDPGTPVRPVIQTVTLNGAEQTFSEQQFYANSYKLKKDVKTNVKPDLKVEVQISVDSRYYTSIGFGVDVSRI